jgi:hypothetical protein
LEIDDDERADDHSQADHEARLSNQFTRQRPRTSQPQEWLHQRQPREHGTQQLVSLREILKQPRWAKDAETLILAHEVQALITPQAATTER